MYFLCSGARPSTIAKAFRAPGPGKSDKVARPRIPNRLRLDFFREKEGCFLLAG